MESYRNDARKIEKEARWTFLRFLPLFLIVVVVLSIVGFGLNSLGIFGRTVVERKVFEQSYQYKFRTEQQAVTWRASIAEIDRRLASSSLSEIDRNNLEAQRSAFNIQLNSIIHR